MNSPRLEELKKEFEANGGKWKEFKIGDLFEKQQLRFKKKMFNKDSDVSKIRTTEFNLPLVNAKDGENGIMYYGRSSDFEATDMSIDIVNDGAVSTGNVYAQPQLTGVLYNAYLIKLKIHKPSEERLLFLSQSIQKSIKTRFGYDNKAGWEKVRKESIYLPVSNFGEIDFSFMENYIRELEKSRFNDLMIYLKANNLENYNLTPDEQKALTDFKNGKILFKKFKITGNDGVFSVKNTHSILKNQITENSGSYPYVTAAENNNSILTHISYDPSFLERGNSIMIGF